MEQPSTHQQTINHFTLSPGVMLPRAGSGSPPTTPVTSIHSPLLPQALPPQMDPLRLQQHLYTLALADRMRMLQPAFGGGNCNPFAGMFFPNSAVMTPQAHSFSPPSDLARFPLAKLDPRLFRIPFPEEPKPQHSYIGLISIAILSSSEKKLVLADIYQYILDNFPYFRHRGPGWRNSIRHNLSLNDCFIKAGRASNGKGHFWAVHPACQEDFQKGDFSRRKAQRKVRKYLGMNVDEEEQDTPPTSPPPPMISPTPSMISPPPSLVSGVASTNPLQPAFNFLQATSMFSRLQPSTIKDEPSTITQATAPQRFSFGIDCILGRVAAEARNQASNNSTHDDNDDHIHEDEDSKSDIEVGVDYEEVENNSSFLHRVSC